MIHDALNNSASSIMPMRKLMQWFPKVKLIQNKEERFTLNFYTGTDQLLSQIYSVALLVGI